MNDSVNLDNIEEIKKIDTMGMLDKVNSFPDMIEEAVKFADNINIDQFNNVESIVISGMGGSAIGGDVVRAILEKKSKIPVIVNRYYTLPDYIKQNSLCFVLSYSGNTEETLFSLKDAEEKNLKIIAITSGGKLSEIAKEKSYPLITIPSGVPPRAALPYLLIPILKVLEKSGIVNNISEDIEESIKILKKDRDEYVRDAKKISKRISGTIPIIIASQGLSATAGLRWLAQLNENGKTVSHLTVLPEMSHNEIVGLAHLKRASNPFSLILLRDDGDNERIKKRIEIVKSFTSPEFGGAIEIFTKGKSDLSRILSLILIGDYISVYAALLKNIDPTTITVIDSFKRELSR